MTGGLDFGNLTPEDVAEAFKDLPEEEACKKIAEQLVREAEGCSTLPGIVAAATRTIEVALKVLKLRLIP